MSVLLQSGDAVFEIGSADFFHAFFSTISFHLENAGWGSRFPVLMNGLYQGHIEADRVDLAASELRIAQDALGHLTPQQVIWDIEDLNKRPPWGDQISDEIKTLADYFVTSDGEDLFEILFQAFAESKRQHDSISVQ